LGNQLIYDVGAHLGEDTEYYLKKGFNVIAIEANPKLCSAIMDKFTGSIGSGNLTVINVAISDNAGELDFYLNDLFSEWGTVNTDWVRRNEMLGGKSSKKITVKSLPLESLIKEYGVPYYLKIDIEGSDVVALNSLRSLEEKPKFVSIESEKVSWEKLLKEFDIFLSCGYKKFKVVNQAFINYQQCPNPAREGVYVDHDFALDSSGLFGHELPGQWMDASQALEYYKSIFYQYVLNGDFGLLKRGNLPPDLKDALPESGWYDTHATF
jgi:FkbM family methyltransferase